MIKKLFILLCMASSFVCNAQVYFPVNFTDAAKKGTRTSTGEPGKLYWQNTADYTMKIKFTPKTRLLEGNETITYYNNSPDTLERLIISLYPDYYKKGALREWSIDGADENDGVSIEKIEINNTTPEYFHEGTNLIALPASFIMPHTKATVTVQWSYVVNAGSHNRTGEVDATSFFLAYTFPRIAVYDDLDGWNMHDYNGLQEFYNDFANFNAEISVPKNFVVWATGDLVNANEVLMPQITNRLNHVITSDSIQYIITKNDISQKKVTAQNKWNTYKYRAQNVTDFAFALSDHYIWQASSLIADQSTTRRVRIDAVYNPEHKGYEHVADIAHKSIQLMCTETPQVPYPYNHETIFDGLDQMEYPMMVNDNPLENYADDVELTSHEIFHTYFPFYMGINETKYAWMDEGWATFGEHSISPQIINDPNRKNELGQGYVNMAGTEADLPLITISSQISGNTYWMESYDKPALCYLFLKDMLGDDLFLKSLHKYMFLWAGKHPTPYDFFTSINTASGKNLNWFWNAWFYQPGFPDIAILNVIKNTDTKYTIVLNSKGNKPTPVNMVITFADSTVKKLHYTAAIWETNNIYYVPIDTQVAITHIELNTENIPDTDTANNSWPK